MLGVFHLLKKFVSENLKNFDQVPSLAFSLFQPTSHFTLKVKNIGALLRYVSSIFLLSGISQYLLCHFLKLK